MGGSCSEMSTAVACTAQPDEEPVASEPSSFLSSSESDNDDRMDGVDAESEESNADVITAAAPKIRRWKAVPDLLRLLNVANAILLVLPVVLLGLLLSKHTLKMPDSVDDSTVRRDCERSPVQQAFDCGMMYVVSMLSLVGGGVHAMIFSGMEHWVFEPFTGI